MSAQLLVLLAVLAYIALMAAACAVFAYDGDIDNGTGRPLD